MDTEARIYLSGPELALSDQNYLNAILAEETSAVLQGDDDGHHILMIQGPFTSVTLP